MTLVNEAGEPLELSPQKKIEQEIREKCFIADEDCENCFGRGWVRRRLSGQDWFEWDYCGCLAKDREAQALKDARKKLQ